MPSHEKRLVGPGLGGLTPLPPPAPYDTSSRRVDATVDKVVLQESAPQHDGGLMLREVE